MDSVEKPFPECIDFLVENIELDPHFKEFFQWTQEHQIPTVILSGGMRPIIKAILKNLIGEDAEKMDIVCNEVEARPGKSIDQPGGWTIKFHDDRYEAVFTVISELMLISASDFGHDKSLTIRPYAKLPEHRRPIMFYAGDGVSDLSAAQETDLLFAKEGHGMSSAQRPGQHLLTPNRSCHVLRARECAIHDVQRLVGHSRAGQEDRWRRDLGARCGEERV